MAVHAPLNEGQELSEWRRGTDDALEAVAEARRRRDWEPLDRLADRLGIPSDPTARGAWDAICDILLTPPWR
jgi:hypothetical protein